MSAQIIKLSDHRKVRHTPLPHLVGLSLSIFNAYADISLAMYGAMVEAAEQVFEAVGIDKSESLASEPCSG